MDDNQTLRRRVLAELVAIGFARVTDFLYVEDGAVGVRSTTQLSPEQCAAVAAIEQSSNGVKVKFYDKMRALELIGKITGLFDGESGVQVEENNLLEALIAATGEEVETCDLPEIQQAAAAGHDLVEPAESAEL